MADADFQHLRLSMVKDVALVEIRTKDVQGPQLAQELGHELAAVIAQDWARRVLVDFRRVDYISSTGFAAVFKLVSRAKAEGREVKLCGLGPGILLGAEIAGLSKVVEIHADQASALRAFASPKD
jgi:anti-anti-sigma factor